MRKIYSHETFIFTVRTEPNYACVIKIDTSSFEDTQRMAKETILKWGKIDILIANAEKYVTELVINPVTS